MEKERTSILLNREDMLKLKAISKNIGKSTTFLIQEAVSEFISKTLPKRKI
jgi:predicted DNA-binding protein